MFKVGWAVQDELDGEGAGGGSSDPLAEFMQEGGFDGDPATYAKEFGDDGGEAAPDDEGEEAGESPAYFIGELDEQTVLDRLSYAGELPEQLRAMESRLTTSNEPLMARLEEVQKAIGAQPAFEPKMDRIREAIRGYDEKLADALVPALEAALKESFSYTPLTQEAVMPFVEPIMSAQSNAVAREATTAMLAQMPFSYDDLVRRDPSNPDMILEPETDLQKDFLTWVGQVDGPTQKALGAYNLGLVGAIAKFSKWRADRLKGKGDAAEEASSRLAGGRQSRGGKRGGSTPPKSDRDAFQEGFDAVFNEMRGSK